jgi:DNA-directed RNA polymerase subunit RPC12/RpoP
MDQDAIYAGVVCPQCGPVDLTFRQYMDQICKPDALWKCPKCGQDSDFDDERFEEIQGIN